MISFNLEISIINKTQLFHLNSRKKRQPEDTTKEMNRTLTVLHIFT
jgi:hypothetical protein